LTQRPTPTGADVEADGDGLCATVAGDGDGVVAGVRGTLKGDGVAAEAPGVGVVAGVRCALPEALFAGDTHCRRRRARPVGGAGCREGA
jgi:hypothetical protein